MRNNILVLTVIAILVLIAGASGAMWYQSSISESADDMTAAQLSEVASIIEPAASDESHEGHDHASEGPSEGLDLNAAAAEAKAADAASAKSVNVVVEGNDPKAPRTIGSIDAPVTILDFSSLTCPHCAKAHATILPQLIKDYVETGKVRIVFNDFPLNEQALDASKVSRCVPADQYYGFLSMLFSSIEQWAYSGNHPRALLQNAALAGLPEDKARACLQDKELETAIMQGLQNAAQKYQVSSTPTFVLNDGAKVISGARNYAEFKSAIDALLAEKQ